MNTYEHAFLGPLQATLERVISFVPRLMVAVVIFVAFYLLASGARKLTRASLERVTKLPWAVRVLIARMVYLGMLLIGILAALSSANVNVTTVVASLGVAGFALGFALKDILENFIAGILLLFARPFEIKDQVTLGSYEGVIYDIQIRTTTIRSYDNDLVLIPNSAVFTNAVVNHTRLGTRRYAILFDTSLTADAAVVQERAVAAVKQCEGVESDPEPIIRVKSVDTGNDVLSWELFAWAKPTRAEQLRVVSDGLRAVKTALFDAGVPTPTSTSATILKRPAAHPAAATGPGETRRDGAAD